MTVSWTRTLKRKEEGYAYSLFLSRLYELYQGFREAQLEDLKAIYPRGIPEAITDSHYFLEETLDGLYSLLRDIQQPFLTYFHFWPPHAPYRTHRDFYNRFLDDGLLDIQKPLNVFSIDSVSKNPSYLPNKRREYDESILYADREFGEFIDKLEESGLIDNTWVIFTSDHGELFER